MFFIPGFIISQRILEKSESVHIKVHLHAYYVSPWPCCQILTKYKNGRFHLKRCMQIHLYSMGKWHSECTPWLHDDVIKWKHFPLYWPFVRGIRRLPVNSPHKSQWRRVLIFSLNCAWINGWVNNREAGDLRRHRAHYDVTAMLWSNSLTILGTFTY